ncbi:hypothetical protein BN135_3323 [Cronobacter muytjensii 530]
MLIDKIWTAMVNDSYLKGISVNCVWITTNFNPANPGE